MTSSKPNAQRSLAASRRAVAAFELDLRDLVVLTEAASGPFVLTPLIAALAGAERVLALTADSRHGSAAEVRDLTAEYAGHFDVADRVEVVTARDDARIASVNVVTNSGFVRPLDRALLEQLGSAAAVTLMCEPWEVRAQDVDFDACRDLGIPVLGTNEDDPRVNTFAYLPAIAAKLLFELQVELFAARLVLISAGKFAAALTDGLEAMGATIQPFAPPLLQRDSAFDDAVAAADAVIVADYPGAGPVIGGESAYSGADLLGLNRGIALAHIAGDVRLNDGRAAPPHAPARIMPAGTMSVTAGWLGPRPVIDLHAAGLKVGEALARARLDGRDAGAAETEVRDNLPLAAARAEQRGSD